jgi:hypothetical protein
MWGMVFYGGDEHLIIVLSLRIAQITRILILTVSLSFYFFESIFESLSCRELAEVRFPAHFQLKSDKILQDVILYKK